MGHTRRQFIHGASGFATAAAMGELGCITPLTQVKAEELQVSPEIVQFNSNIEPIVQLIENTSREKCFEMMLDQLVSGLPYRQFVAALFLAGIRNVRPHPLGFKFHCVLAIHAAHQISLDLPVKQRLLPMFWMLDDFKKSQQEDVAKGDYRMPPPPEPLPSPGNAWKEFHAAMNSWDESKADSAMTTLVRSRGAQDVMEGLWRYGARDYRNIGHKSIYVAGALQVLQAIGWRHAEPILRSVAMGMTDFGATERVNMYAYDDQCYSTNRDRAVVAGRLPGDWTTGRPDSAVTREMLDVIRSGDFEACSEKAVRLLLTNKTSAIPLWDAVHLASAELMLRKPGIFGIHTVTSVNALRYGYQQSSNPETRLLMLLQANGWMCQFRNFMSGTSGGLREKDITSLEPADVASESDEALLDIFADIGVEPDEAAAKTFAYAKRHDTSEFAAAARQLIALKTREVHGLKYPAAIFEDHNHVSPSWRPHMLATSTYYLPGTNQPDSPVMQRARDALGRI